MNEFIGILLSFIIIYNSLTYVAAGIKIFREHSDNERKEMFPSMMIAIAFKSFGIVAAIWILYNIFARR